MNSPRAAHTATLLNNGQVLVAGGVDNTGAVRNTAELFDPVAGKFTLTADMTTARSRPARDTTRQRQGAADRRHRGDWDATCYSRTVDPLARTFGPAASMATARYDHVVVMLKDGTVLVAGGTGSSGARIRLKSTTRSWTHSDLWARLASPRTLETGVLLK